MAIRPKVLVVGMLDSIHLARWITQLDKLEAEVIVTGTSPYRRIRPELETFVGNNRDRFSIVELYPQLTIGGRRFLPAISFIADRYLGDRIRGTLLRRLFKEVQPTIIHVNEVIVAGMPVEFALREQCGTKFKIWTTNYGSEISWYGRREPLKSRISRLLKASDVFSAECSRDVGLALKMGFEGQVMPVFPVTGGIKARPLRPRSSNCVAIKGYDNDLGMGAHALRVAGEFAMRNPHLELELVVYSCNSPTYRLAKRLAKKGLRVTALKKGALSHGEMLDLFSKSVAYIGASRSDGISTSVLEAMSQGAIPIQTATSCADEWFVDGETGFSVDAENLEQIAQALDRIFSESFDLETARARNLAIIEDRANPDQLAKIAIQGYLALI